jgi:hypothetical protein
MVVSALLDWMFYSHKLAMIVPIGGCLITCGLYLVVFAQAREKAEAEAEEEEEADDEESQDEKTEYAKGQGAAGAKRKPLLGDFTGEARRSGLA